MFTFVLVIVKKIVYFLSCQFSILYHLVIRMGHDEMDTSLIQEAELVLN